MAIYRYTVCWRDEFCRPYQWKSSEFPQKDKAKKVAKSIKTKQRPKPYIIQTIVMDCYFGVRDDIERVENKKLNYITYEKRIKY